MPASMWLLYADRPMFERRPYPTALSAVMCPSHPKMGQYGAPRTNHSAENASPHARTVWEMLYRWLPQAGHTLFFEESPMGMNATKSGKTIQNTVDTQSSPPR